MKRLLYLGSLPFIVAVSSLAVLLAQDIVKQLGLREDQAHDIVFNVIQTGSTETSRFVDATRVIKKADQAARAALITAALQWARAYAESADLKKYWAEWSESQKPKPPEGPSPDEKIKEEIAKLQKQRDDAKQALAEEQSAEAKASLQESLKFIDEMLAKYKDPAYVAEQKKYAQMDAANAKESYERDLKEWRAGFPEDFRPLMVKRLKYFLDLSPTVDFNAQLVKCGQHQCFADKRYEAKPDDWKLCYRAGKEAVAAARTFATQWLADLQKKTTTDDRPD